MPHTGHTAESAAEPDYNRPLRANLECVFNERDAGKRAVAIADLFVADPILFEPANIVKGRAAICEVAGALLERFGPTFRFSPDGNAVGHHGLGSLPWRAGPDDGTGMITGTDVAEIIDGRIARLWVLLDPTRA